MSPVATPFGPVDVFTILIFLGAFVALMAVLIAFMAAANSGDRRTRGRLAKIQMRVTARGADGEVAQLRRNFRDSTNPTFDKIVKRLVPTTAELRRKLARTGKRITMGEYLLTNVLVGAAIATVAHKFSGAPAALALLVGIAAGIGLPYLAVGWMAGKRMANFLKLFPDAIDLIVRGLKSGLPVSESITLVGQEVLDPVGSEFRHITDAVKLGQPLEVALIEATTRIPLTDFQFFVITLSVQKETGGNLAETLENLGQVLRKRKTLKLKIKALSSEAKASAYIIGSLPFLMFGVLLTMNYGYASTLYTDPRGIILVGCGFISYSLGIGTMAKMVRFDV